jgi:hypothetical protein
LERSVMANAFNDWVNLFIKWFTSLSSELLPVAKRSVVCGVMFVLAHDLDVRRERDPGDVVRLVSHGGN